MSFRNGGQLVTQGLVFYVDAGSTKSFVSGQSSVFDVSSNGVTGVLSGTVGWVPTNGGGWTFNGNGSIPTTFATALADFTVCAWFSGSTTPVGVERICDKDFIAGFWLGRSGSAVASTWGGGVCDGGSPFGIFITGLTDGRPNLLTSIRAGAVHTIYGNDGSLVATGTVTTSALSTARFSIGSVYDSMGNSLHGAVFAVSIYNRALSATEVSQNYNSTKGRYGL